MGGACLRDHGHRWPAGGSRRPASRGERQGDVAGEHDPPRSDARPQLLRAGGYPDAVHHGDAQEQPDAVAECIAVDLSVAFSNRGNQRFGQSVPLADRHGDAVTVAERQRETVGLALTACVSRR